MTATQRRVLALAAAAVAAAAATLLLAAGVTGHGERNRIEIAKQGSFFVGITPSAQADGTTRIKNQMHVQYQIPSKLTHPYPIVMIHGGGGQALDYLTTPDGRPGWAPIFLQAGYAVYVVDRPAYGRSANNVEYGPLGNAATAEQVQMNFTAPERYNLWPQAQLHNQWPGTGLLGDPAFDQFLASQNPGPSVDISVLRQNMAELLDRIGPAIVMMHSAGGPTGWNAPDVRPKLVKGVLAIEAGSPQSQLLQYDPPIASTAELSTVSVPSSDPDLLPCTLQTEPARRLVNYRRLPVLSVTGEASSAWRTIQCGPAWINQAGGSAEVLRLEDAGIRGNGHLMMLERNNRRIAEVLIRWLERNVERRR